MRSPRYGVRTRPSQVRSSSSTSGEATEIGRSSTRSMAIKLHRRQSVEALKASSLVFGRKLLSRALWEGDGTSGSYRFVRRISSDKHARMHGRTDSPILNSSGVISQKIGLL